LKNFKSNATISLNILGNNLTSESLFIPSQGKISTLLENFPEIENINVKKDFFTKKIVIEVKEKTPVFVYGVLKMCVFF
jgi:cell division septal protein FtsQ